MNQEWSAQDQARQALRAVIADFGPQVLGNADMLGNLLRDHLPDRPREVRLLAAAAQSGAATAVDERIRSGMQAAAAVRMTAAELSNSHAIDPAAAEWAVGEFAIALGHNPQPAAGPAGPAGPALAGGMPQVAAGTQAAAGQHGGQQTVPQAIGAQPTTLAGQPPTGYGQQQQQYYAPPPVQRKSRGPLIASICAVAVVAAAIGVYFATKSSPTPAPTRLTGAKCLVGTWRLRTAHETVDFTGFGNEVWDFSGGTDEWTFVAGGTGRVYDSQFTLTTASSARTRGRFVSTASGTFGYHVVGGQIQYNHVRVPGTVALDNLTTGKNQSNTYKSTWVSSPDEFTCSGNTLVRYGTGYSFDYARQLPG